jgi:hypothetical protein
MYGSFLSGGLAGHIYGVVGLWGGDVEEAAPHTIWDALMWESGAQMEHLRTFVWSEGARFQELVPLADLISPNKTHEIKGNRGWAYCARTPERDLFMLYYEADCPVGTLRGALYQAQYAAQWFNPRTGEWIDAGTLRSTDLCEIALPALPGERDWALKLTLHRGD